MVIVVIIVMLKNDNIILKKGPNVPRSSYITSKKKIEKMKKRLKTVRTIF